MVINSADDVLQLKVDDNYRIFSDYRLACFEDGYDSAIKHLWLNNIEGVDAGHIVRLKQALGNVWNIYDASEKVLSSVVPEPMAKKIVMSRSGGKIAELYDRLGEKGVSILYPEKSQYPHKLRHIHTPPQLLYVKGRIKNTLNEYNKTIGIVGSRNPSVYGKEICRYFGEGLAKAGFNIVSGMARGIDGIAHKAALDNNGYTLAVLGSGINVVYPRSNIELYSNIEENGAIISEYGLDVNPNPWQFPIRNRIISGLSDGVLVVEARLESGSLITADHALEQGRIVYSVPGRLLDKYSEGNNNIIREGAICVTKPEDIIEDMLGVSNTLEESGCNITPGKKYTDNTNKKNIAGSDFFENLSDEENSVMSVLSLDPMYIDEIMQRTHLGITNTISVLYILEKKALIKQIDKGYYILHI